MIYRLPGGPNTVENEPHNSPSHHDDTMIGGDMKNAELNKDRKEGRWKGTNNNNPNGITITKLQLRGSVLSRRSRTSKPAQPLFREGRTTSVYFIYNSGVVAVEWIFIVFGFLFIFPDLKISILLPSRNYTHAWICQKITEITTTKIIQHKPQSRAGDGVLVESPVDYIAE